MWERVLSGLPRRVRRFSRQQQLQCATDHGRSVQLLHPPETASHGTRHRRRADNARKCLHVLSMRKADDAPILMSLLLSCCPEAVR